MIDLTPFCNPDCPREELRQPFSDGAFTYATDGYVIVRVPGKLTDVTEPPFTSNISTIFDGIDTHAYADPITITVPPGQERTETCPQCEGTGLAHDCPTCRCDCKECLGAKFVTVTEEVILSYRGVYFDARYFRRVAALPRPQLQAAIPPAATSVAFRFDGGYGLIAIFHPDCPEAAIAIEQGGVA